MQATSTLYCATSNPGKLREFKLAGELIGWDVQPLPGLKSLVPPEETGDTFEHNARLKATYYSRMAPGPLFADDSGLEVDALHGAPGVFSARFAGEHATDDENNRELLARLGSNRNRTARFVCVVAIAMEGIVERTFRAEVQGEILYEPRGTQGFGYDPLFFYPPFDCSFGEAAPEMKFAVSHRGKALHAMMQYLSTNATRFA